MRPACLTRRQAFRLAVHKSWRSLRKLTRRRAISFAWTWSWTWTRRRRWRRSREIGPLSRKEALEDPRAKIRLGRILIGPNRYRHGVVRVVELRFDRGDLLLLDEEEIAVQFARHIVFLVITDAAEIIEHPRQRIRARANNVTNQLVSARIGMGQLQHRVGEFVNVVVSLDIDVWLGVGGAAEIIQPDAVSKRKEDQNAREKFCNLLTSQRHQQQRRSQNQCVRPDVFEFFGLLIVNRVGKQAEK